MFRLVLWSPNVQTTKPSGNSSFCKSLGHFHVQVLHAKLMTNCTMQACAAANSWTIMLRFLMSSACTAKCANPKSGNSSFCCCKSLEQLHSGFSCQAKLITKCENPNPAILQAPANLLDIRMFKLLLLQIPWKREHLHSCSLCQAHHHQHVQTAKPSSNSSFCCYKSLQYSHSGSCTPSSSSPNVYKPPNPAAMQASFCCCKSLEHPHFYRQICRDCRSREHLWKSSLSPKTQLRGKRNNRLLRESMSLRSSQDRSFVKPRKRVRPRDFLLLSLLPAPAIIHGTLQSRHVKQAWLQWKKSVRFPVRREGKQCASSPQHHASPHAHEKARHVTCCSATSGDSRTLATRIHEL